MRREKTSAYLTADNDTPRAVSTPNNWWTEGDACDPAGRRLHPIRSGSLDVLPLMFQSLQLQASNGSRLHRPCSAVHAPQPRPRRITLEQSKDVSVRRGDEVGDGHARSQAKWEVSCGRLVAKRWSTQTQQRRWYFLFFWVNIWPSWGGRCWAGMQRLRQQAPGSIFAYWNRNRLVSCLLNINSSN